jgi:hypothetical protein
MGNAVGVSSFSYEVVGCLSSVTAQKVWEASTSCAAVPFQLHQWREEAWPSLINSSFYYNEVMQKLTILW